MNIKDYIKELSVKDKKTLSQKALKLTEEVGELARVVLPYDSAHGTNHRFIDREALLEEVVDVYLTNISIAHSLGFTEEEFNEMLDKKSKKWGSLQSKEEKATFPLPYEIHVTIDLDEYITGIWRETISDPRGGVIRYPEEAAREQRLGWKKTAISEFKKACKEIGVKPIVLDLENAGKSVMKDVMTSSHFYGDNKTAYVECMRIANHMVKKGFVVNRKKIESVPWHPAAPVNDGDKMPDNCYYEAHIGCIITPEQKTQLQQIAERVGSHLSTNFFKKLENGKFVNMITHRSHGDLYKHFEGQVNYLKDLLDSSNIEYEKVITEFSVYDTNVSHDNKWLTNEKEIEKI
jgi:NTP pyrophosphatase (non-canonical NTP hydrolase)